MPYFRQATLQHYHLTHLQRLLTPLHQSLVHLHQSLTLFLGPLTPLRHSLKYPRHDYFFLSYLLATPCRL